eukprot:Rhum_TRINITY_DN11290_c0_g3::Rhum_TRINITY_DN11290_c0_g3_i1::g.43711::m.43711
MDTKVPPLYHTFYTQRWLLVESRGLGLLYWGTLAGVAFWTFFLQLVMHNSFVARHKPEVSVNFWQDRAIDGNWWYRTKKDPEYCDRPYYWGGAKDWGSDSVACLDPADHPNSTFFYQTTGSVSVATSIAYGTESYSDKVRLYKGIENTTLVLQPSYWTEKEVSFIPGCVAYDTEGRVVKSRVLEVYPNRNASSVVWQEREEYLMLSLADILRAANVTFDDIGDEDAMLRLQGVELIAHVDVRNYHKPFRPSSELECSVRFRIVRNQFTLAKRFYEKDAVYAVQYGVRINVVATGSVGYPDLRAFLNTIVLGLGGFAVAQTLADFVAQFIHPRKGSILKASIDHLTLELPSRAPSIDKGTKED